MVGRGMTGGHWVLHGGGRSGGFDGGMNAPRESGASFLYRGGDDRRGGPQGGRQVNNQRNQWDGGKQQ